MENLLFAKDFGLFCFVFAMIGVESMPTEETKFWAVFSEKVLTPAGKCGILMNAESAGVVEW